MRALLIRHAASSGQAPDAPLSAEGFEAAERLASWLAAQKTARLFSSPYLRAQQTLARFAANVEQDVTILDDLRERLLSPTEREDWQQQICLSFDDPDHACPGGESVNDVRERAGRALAFIEEQGGPVPVFVTHGGLTSALFSAVDPAFGFDAWKSLRNPDVFAVHIAGAQITSFERIEWDKQV
ncbi:MAG: histidine phosphatase family protein [Pseudomonadota bacterium]